jgi:hypothetical protein
MLVVTCSSDGLPENDAQRVGGDRPSLSFQTATAGGESAVTGPRLFASALTCSIFRFLRSPAYGTGPTSRQLWVRCLGPCGHITSPGGTPTLKCGPKVYSLPMSSAATSTTTRACRPSRSWATLFATPALRVDEQAI